jgi:hypothetical protein
MTTEQLESFNQTASETVTWLFAIAAAAREAAAALNELADAQARLTL